MKCETKFRTKLDAKLHRTSQQNQREVQYTFIQELHIEPRAIRKLLFKGYFKPYYKSNWNKTPK